MVSFLLRIIVAIVDNANRHDILMQDAVAKGYGQGGGQYGEQIHSSQFKA